MWRRVTLDVHLDHPPSRVYPYFADPGRWPEFAPAVDSRRPLDSGPLQVGNRWAAVDRIGPFRIRFTDVLEVVEPDRRVVWHSTSPWNSRVEYVCTPDAGARGSTPTTAATSPPGSGWWRSCRRSCWRGSCCATSPASAGCSRRRTGLALARA